ncbi:M20/M25/M40 family metallo-hydrolase [Verticiella sediminum]|uniref:M20/M25/M40 family metallo-hydrolase n=1 Tax=Verticiella sediminum TaxID=1247510 RepID=A0A556AFV6_9BURK|nr:M20/M25/M40 family metallo-hydrolase [Verticiella sediminum]TSH91772.1 M20/M25/M40 family metallo-hydrolase [Verticiella sediminum]
MSNRSTPYALLDAILANEATWQTSFLQRLVQTPSDNPPGDCAPIARVAAEMLTALGWTVEQHEVPADLVRANGMRSAINLIVRRSFGSGGPVIAMNAHGDVVPPGDGWRHEPYGGDIEEDAEHGPCLYGRGAAVSKSDFATYAWALLALERLAAQDVRLNGTVELHFTFDEEAGGDIGPRWLLAEGLSKPDYAISAGFSYAVVVAHNGCLHLEVTVRGKQAHAAMPDTGVDALQASTHMLQALYAFRETLARRASSVPGISHPTLNVGLIQGGINTNVVPDKVSFRLDRRIVPEETGQDVEGELRELIAQAAAACPGIAVDVQRIMHARALAQLPGTRELVAPLQRHAGEIFGTEIAEVGSPLYTDARHYAEFGVPTVLYGAGPRTLAEARGHNSDENIRLRDLQGATQVIARTLHDLLAR